MYRFLCLVVAIYRIGCYLAHWLLSYLTTTEPDSNYFRCYLLFNHSIWLLSCQIATNWLLSSCQIATNWLLFARQQPIFLPDSNQLVVILPDSSQSVVRYLFNSDRKSEAQRFPRARTSCYVCRYVHT